MIPYTNELRNPFAAQKDRDIVVKTGRTWYPEASIVRTKERGPNVIKNTIGYLRCSDRRVVDDVPNERTDDSGPARSVLLRAGVGKLLFDLAVAPPYVGHHDRVQTYLTINCIIRKEGVPGIKRRPR